MGSYIYENVLIYTHEQYLYGTLVLQAHALIKAKDLPGSKQNKS
jgi:hypothetical protein